MLPESLNRHSGALDIQVFPLVVALDWVCHALARPAGRGPTGVTAAH